MTNLQPKYECKHQVTQDAATISNIENQSTYNLSNKDQTIALKI